MQRGRPWSSSSRIKPAPGESPGHRGFARRTPAPGGDEDEATAALLHDAVEDVPGWTPERLRREGFSEAVLTAVEALSRRKDEDDETFIARAGADPIARRVPQLRIGPVQQAVQRELLPAMGLGETLFRRPPGDGLIDRIGNPVRPGP